MKSFFSALPLCLLLVSCNKSDSQNCSSGTQAEESQASASCTLTTPTEPVSSTTPDKSTGGEATVTTPSTPVVVAPPVTSTPPTDSALPNEAYTFDSNMTFYNTSATQEAKFHKAVEIIKKVVATEAFRERVVNFKYNGKKTYVDNGGFTNEQIYQKILDGAEELSNVKNNQMDMEVELYTASGSTVGYTYATSKRIWVNTKFFNGYDASGVAHNLFHEWLHKLGFTHAVSYSVSRDSSVPYAIGDLVGEIGKDFL